MPAPVAAGRLKSFVERIENVREGKKSFAEDERDIFKEAKSAGFDTKTIRWLLKEREVDAVDRQERDYLRDTYAHALGMAVELVEVQGLSLRQAEAATGVSKSSIQRALAVPQVSQVEMTEADLGDFLLLVSRDEDRIQAEEIAIEGWKGRPMVDGDLGDPLLITNPFRAKVRAIAANVKSRPKVPDASDTVIARAPDDDLAIPPFLRRSPQQERVR